MLLLFFYFYFFRLSSFFYFLYSSKLFYISHKNYCVFSPFFLFLPCHQYLIPFFFLPILYCRCCSIGCFNRNQDDTSSWKCTDYESKFKRRQCSRGGPVTRQVTRISVSWFILDLSFICETAITYSLTHLLIPLLSDVA